MPSRGGGGFQLNWQGTGSGQTLFAFCGAPGPGCESGQTYRQVFAMPATGAVTSYQFERYICNGAGQAMIFAFGDGTVKLDADHTVTGWYNATSVPPSGQC